MLKVAPAAAALFMLGACNAVSSERLTEVSLGMSKAEVTERLGPPAVARGATTNKYGQHVEVWEYRISAPKTPKQTGGAAVLTVLTVGLAAPLLFTPGVSDYWLYFVDGALAQWGQAGDWAKAADQIYEIRFGDATNSLTH